VSSFSPKVCAVIVAAYRAESWIGECLDSIEGQEPLDGWRYETRIGVDGCLDTARALKERGTPFWWSAANVGPYLIRNALMRAPADAFAIFDADDVMYPAYLATLLPLMGDGIVGTARIGMDEDGNVGDDPKVYPHLHGVGVFSAAAIEKIGGFRPWRIRADADAWLRAKVLKVPITKHDEPLFMRRSHPGSLTNSPTTGMRTRERKDRARESKRLTRKGHLRVVPEYARLEWRDVQRGAA
jgi:hypothetical protein